MRAEIPSKIPGATINSGPSRAWRNWARREVVMATAGHNIFERSSWSDLGHTMALFGGGGHRGAGSCPLPPDDGDATLRRLVSELKRQG